LAEESVSRLIAGNADREKAKRANTSYAVAPTCLVGEVTYGSGDKVDLWKTIIFYLQNLKFVFKILTSK